MSAQPPPAAAEGMSTPPHPPVTEVSSSSSSSSSSSPRDPSRLDILYRATEPLVWKARNTPLSAKDLNPLADMLKTDTVKRAFDEMMRGVVWRRLKDESLSGDDDSHFIKLNTQEEVDAAIAETADRPRLYTLQGYSLFGLLLRLVRWQLFISFVLTLGRLGTTILSCWALWTIVRFIAGDPDYNYSTGVQYVVGLMLPISATFLSTILHNSIHACTRAGLMSRSALVAIIYEKLTVLTPLHLSEKEGEGKGGHAAAEVSTEAASAASGGVSAGQLINLFSSDANTVIEGMIVCVPALMQIVDISACIVWIGWEGGWAAAIALAYVVVLMIVQMLSGSQVAAMKKKAATICDQRLRSLNEFLSGIQVVKFYAWEENVRRMIYGIRADEAAAYISSSNWKMINIFGVYTSIGVLSIIVFACRYIYEGPVMDPGSTFLIMTLISYITRGFAWLPRSLAGIANAIASVNRIQAVMQRDVRTGLPKVDTRTTAADGDDAATTPLIDNAPDSTTTAGTLSRHHMPADANAPDHDDACEMTAVKTAAHTHIADDDGLHLVGDFGWSGFAVRDIALFCPKGTLTVIMGSVGSGKSTLLQAVLGVCAALSPEYTIKLPGTGTVAYVAQEAFIYDATVRENITFGKPFDEAKYRRVIKACSLVTDFQQWGGDLVEVTGNTLSGGQRQRLSLARACYADADLYIVDDPISAVDASVGRHLLRKCFAGYLKNKTVLLTTHHSAPARYADQVVLMEGGTARLRPITEAAVNAIRQYTTEHPEAPDAESGATPRAMTEEDLTKAMDRIDRENTAANDAYEEAAAHAEHPPHEEEEDHDEEAEAAQDAVLDALIGTERTLRVQEVEASGAMGLGVYMAYIKGGGYVRSLVLAVLFCLLQAVKSITDWWFSAWSSRQFPELSYHQHLYILAIYVGLIAFIGLVLGLIYSSFTVNAASALHNNMFEAVIGSPLYFFEEVPLGRITNRFSKDLDYCDDALPRNLIDLLVNGLVILGAIALLIYATPWFAIAVPFAVAIFVFLISVFMPASRYMKRIEGSSRSPTMNTFQTVINGLTTLRVYDRLDYFRDILYDTSDVTTNAIIHTYATQIWLGVRIDCVAIAFVLLAAFLCIGLQDDIGPAKVGLAISQSLAFTGFMQYCVRMMAETENLMTSVERLTEYSSLPPEENKGTIKVAQKPSSEAMHAVTVQGAGSDVSAPAELLPASWPEGCDIVTKGLTVAYHSNPNVPVLKNLNFTIKAGQRVAVVGRTGAGKSSLLSCFYRTVAVPDGSIKIGGVSTTDMDVFALRSKIGIIPQVPTLFHGTFRYNLDPFGQYTDEAMIAALTKVTLMDYVKEREGLDTLVSDGGANLSVGQRQLLCAARVLLTGTSILFMDEATANIDEETDEKIQQIMRDEAASRQMTIITIAHRLNTIMDYDLVLVLSQGRLIEYGNPRDLVEIGSDIATAPTTTGVHTSGDGGFTVDVHALDEVRQFARMVETMNQSHE